ncbi:MAG TPA: PAS domain S-box protein, partial [Planctomycetaceae bacterium]
MKILAGEHAGRAVELRDDTIVIGRHPACEIRMSEETVSRRHARIIVADGGYFVEDLGSRNGTYVNGQRVTAPWRLCDLDTISIFNTEVEFRDGGASVDGTQDQTLLFNGQMRTVPKPGANSVATKSAVSKSTATKPDGMHAAAQKATDPKLPAAKSTCPKATGLFETLAEIDLTVPGVPTARRDTDVKLQAVLEITQYLRSTLEPDEVLSRITECVTHIFPHYSRSYLLRYDAATDRLVPVVVRQPEDELEGPQTLRPVIRELARQVLNHGKAVLSVATPAADDDADTASVFSQGARSFMCAPLVGPSIKSAGILYIETSDDRRRFSHADLEIFACVAILAGQAIEQATWFGARYRAVVDNAVDGIITVSDQGKIESVNAAVVKLFGYAADELVGKNVDLLVTDEDRQRHGSSLRELLRTGLAPIVGAGHEVLARRKNGTSFPIYLSIGPFELGGRQYYTGIVHDISERHEAEQALRRVNESLEQQVRDRTESIRLLQDVAVIANESESVEKAFEIVLARVLRFRKWEAAHVLVRSRGDQQVFVDAGIWTVERTGPYRRLIAAAGRAEFRAGQGLIGRAIASAKPEWAGSFSQESAAGLEAQRAASGLLAVVACPVVIGTEVVAVVEFFSASPIPPDETFLEIMKHVGTQMGRVIERDRLQRQLVDAVWDQHRRLGQELHDTLGQALTGIGMVADSLAKRLAAREQPEADKQTELVSMIQQAKSEVRQLAKGLYPVDVDAQGLLAALEELALSTQQRTHVRCTFHGDREVQIRDNEVATHLFRIAQEAVHNAVKHAHPSRIALALTKPRGRVTLSIRDDGAGISAGDSAGTI